MEILVNLQSFQRLGSGHGASEPMTCVCTAQIAHTDAGRRRWGMALLITWERGGFFVTNVISTPFVCRFFLPRIFLEFCRVWIHWNAVQASASPIAKIKVKLTLAWKGQVLCKASRKRTGIGTWTFAHHCCPGHIFEV